jgi:hypothetical protein
MPQPAELKFEIGHVLFMDIVGYSKLVIDKQTELTRKLNEIVRNSEEFRRAETEGTLVRLPTGDGIALVFRSSPEAPAHVPWKSPPRCGLIRKSKCGWESTAGR